MKKLILSMIIALPTSCATYIKGDLQSKNISDTPVQMNLTSMVNNQKTGIIVVGDRKYDITLKYDTTEPVNFAASYITMFTLGLIPMYSTNNADVEVTVNRNGNTILSEKLDSRFHTYYGWWAKSLAETSDSKDVVNGRDFYEWNMEKTLDNRTSRYLRKKLKYLVSSMKCNVR